jgi:hypothetical protein
MATYANIGSWKFYWSPTTGVVYCLGLGGIDFNLRLFEIVRKSQSDLAVSSAKVVVSHSLLWVKKLYKDGNRIRTP